MVRAYHQIAFLVEPDVGARRGAETSLIARILRRGRRAKTFEREAFGSLLVGGGFVVAEKNIVILCDGTGNELRAKGITNVVRLADLLKRDDPESQVMFYDPGVGTMGAQGALTPFGRGITKFLGLAFGYGLRANVVEGYEFIMDQYNSGDRIFLFGFSRGAYTARAIAGLINHVGLLPPGNNNLIPYAMKLFWHSMEKGGKRVYPMTDDEWNLAHQFSDQFARHDFRRKKEGGIAYLGAWDTVNATGSLRRTVVLPYTARLEVVERARHAVAIDERRKPYRPNLFKFDGEGFDRRASRELHEVWFVGVHSDVGGDRRLGDITLQWVVEGAVDQGIDLDVDRFVKYRELPTATALSSLGVNEGFFWNIVGRADRKILPKDALIHESVLVRRDRLDYNPKQLPADPPSEPWPHNAEAD